MKRIAILGCENSHANAFLKFIKEKEEFSDVEIVGVYSEKTEASEKLNAKFGVPIMNDHSEAVGKLEQLLLNYHLSASLTKFYQILLCNY